MKTLNTNAIEVFDKAVKNFQAMEDIQETLGELFEMLLYVRQHNGSQWKQCVAAYRQHDIMNYVQQDPLTHRSFVKPRGYPGDAELLDFVYASEDGRYIPALHESSELGKHIYDYINCSGTARAVNTRRKIIVDKLDTLAATKTRPDVLSLACGHLREAADSTAVLQGKLGRFLALDQDRESLAVVEREAGRLGIETMAVSVRDIIKQRVNFADFDFVYAAGLYDYLALPIAQRLTELLFAMLKPGGQLLIPNFLPTTPATGYMEAFMDWWLIYRTKPELLEIADTLPEKQIEMINLYTEENNSIAFLEIERKG